MAHAYDNPDLSAVQFLHAVLRDQSVSLADRIHAARAIAEVESVSAFRAIDDVFFAAMMHKQWEDFSAEQHAYFNALPEHEQREFMSVVDGLMRSNELGVGDLKFMSVKGHG